jgi:hypothetical protein
MGKGGGVKCFTECVCCKYFFGERLGGVNGCTECVCCEYCYGEMEVGLTVVLNVCVVNNFMGKGRRG